MRGGLGRELTFIMSPVLTIIDIFFISSFAFLQQLKFLLLQGNNFCHCLELLLELFLLLLAFLLLSHIFGMQLLVILRNHSVVTSNSV